MLESFIHKVCLIGIFLNFNLAMGNTELLSHKDLFAGAVIKKCKIIGAEQISENLCTIVLIEPQGSNKKALHFVDINFDGNILGTTSVEIENLGTIKTASIDGKVIVLWVGFPNNRLFMAKYENKVVEIKVINEVTMGFIQDAWLIDVGKDKKVYILTQETEGPSKGYEQAYGSRMYKWLYCYSFSKDTLTLEKKAWIDDDEYSITEFECSVSNKSIFTWRGGEHFNPKKKGELLTSIQVAEWAETNSLKWTERYSGGLGLFTSVDPNNGSVMAIAECDGSELSCNELTRTIKITSAEGNKLFTAGMFKGNMNGMQIVGTKDSQYPWVLICKGSNGKAKLFNVTKFNGNFKPLLSKRMIDDKLIDVRVFYAKKEVYLAILTKDALKIVKLSGLPSAQNEILPK